MKKNRCLVAILVLVSSLVQAEYILYRVDKQNPNLKLPIDYEHLSQDQRLALKKLYDSTIVRYEWPTVLSSFPRFSPQERASYLQALEQPHGLLYFIDKAVNQQSQGQFGVAYVPTTVFELVAILLSLKILDKRLINNLYKNCYNYKTFGLTCDEVVFSQLQLCAIFDYIITHFVDQEGFFLKTTSQNMPAILSFIQAVGNQIQKFPNINELVVDAQNPLFSHLYEYHPFYSDAWLPIIQNYGAYELQAAEQNCFTLLRGTNGFISSLGDVIDYPIGKEFGLSYGYSLFAGTFFERYYSSVSLSTKGARAIDFIYTSKIGYVVLLSIKEALIGNLPMLFWLPSSSVMRSLFLSGEHFHPRARMISQNLKQENVAFAMVDINSNKLLLASRIADFSKVLSQAKLIKFAKTLGQSQKLLQEDIELQQYELMQSETQNRLSLDWLEKIDFYNNIIVPWVQNGGSLAGFSPDILKICKDDLIDTLTPQQIGSLSPEMLMQFKEYHPDNQRLKMV